jgi:hypothetical protein
MRKTTLSSTKDEFMLSLRKESNQLLFEQRRKRFLEREKSLNSNQPEAQTSETSNFIEFCYDDLLEGEPTMKILQGREGLLS